eukprot:gnl/TRDRNA2_/TRDRNA2_167818_c0_seq5.p2 gnl/TRDRNA2_/TRDRNA2_167818_c0~~gnl/TRDRNA2_/TRDRNA2_167818_c0_seq5.p2  ORF type:complete len:166 (-),score=10.01 gnl/TRDRNA2_/TRDRNA2_167818_c0_seq5:224-721(-)
MRVFMAGVRNFGSTWPMSLSKMVLLVHVTLSGSRINVALLAPMNPQKFLKVRLDRAAGLRANSIYRRDSPHQPVHVLSPGMWKVVSPDLSCYGSLESAIFVSGCAAVAYSPVYVCMLRAIKKIRVLTMLKATIKMQLLTLRVRPPVQPTLLVCERGGVKITTNGQ